MIFPLGCEIVNGLEDSIASKALGRHVLLRDFDVTPASQSCRNDCSV